jgi:hypothetical protein
MERFFRRKSVTSEPDNGGSSSGGGAAAPTPVLAARPYKHNSSVPELIDLDELPRDPAKRKRMCDYHPNQQNEIRRKYLLWGPYQSRTFDFPFRIIAGKRRRFNPDWFGQYANWLEYSEIVRRRTKHTACVATCLGIKILTPIMAVRHLWYKAGTIGRTMTD